MFDSLLDRCELDVAITRKWDASTELITILVALTPVIIAEISKILICLIDAKKDVEIEYKGIKFKGFKKEEVYEILDQLEKREAINTKSSEVVETE